MRWTGPALGSLMTIAVALSGLSAGAQGSPKAASDPKLIDAGSHRPAGTIGSNLVDPDNGGVAGTGLGKMPPEGDPAGTGMSVKGPPGQGIDNGPAVK